MEDVPLSRPYLESLTTGDLLGIADSLGVDTSNYPDRALVIEELLEVSSQEEQKSSNSQVADMTDSALVESVPLPKQYNITFIEVMIRDPLWAFVFWEIKAQDKEQIEKEHDFDGYYLKVSPWVVPAVSPELTPEGKPVEPAGVFTVPVNPNDTAWYLGLAPAVENEKSREDQRQYKVELCVEIKGEETVLAFSSPFRLPLLHELSAGKEPKEEETRSCPAETGKNPLVRLSGYGDFHILRSNERLFRPKRGASGTYE